MGQSSRYEVRLPVFEGPLDLLLYLIEREELDITLVALAQVTDQYLAYVRELSHRDVRELSNFLVVAAKLLLIKSLALLPRPSRLPPEAEEAGEELVHQLQVYKQFKEVAALLGRREEQGLRCYVRTCSPVKPTPQLDMEGITLQDLLAAVQRALEALPAPPVDEVISPVTLTVADQIAYIERQLARRASVYFSELLAGARSRLEIIVTLLAVLELIKQDRISVRQERLFGDILIERAVTSEPSAAGH
ncbi:MAG: segregation/condensation protein A [Anaerolineae bacterium]|nr:segregation/condensation protein A [Anaerolineae bacterium]